MSLFRSQIVYKGFTVALTLLLVVPWGLPSCTHSTDPGVAPLVNEAGDAWALYEALGQECTEAKDCAGALCSDGVCCTKSCTGPCESCDQPGFEGQCLPKRCNYPAPYSWDFEELESDSPDLQIVAPSDSMQADCFDAEEATVCPSVAESWECSQTPFCGQDAQYAQRTYWTNEKRFVSIGDKILDQSTQVLWTNTQITLSYDAAQSECQGLDDGSWALASREELVSLVAFGTYGPASPMPGIQPESYWARDLLSTGDEQAWTVSFLDGSSVTMDVAEEHHVLCARKRVQE